MESAARRWLRASVWVTRAEQAFSRTGQGVSLAVAIAYFPEERKGLLVRADRFGVVALAQIGGGEAGQGVAVLLPIADLARQSKRCRMTGAGLRVLVAGDQAFAHPVKGVGFPAPVADFPEQRQGFLVISNGPFRPAQTMAYPAKRDQVVGFAVPVAELARQGNVPLVVHDYLLVAALRVVAVA